MEYCNMDNEKIENFNVWYILHFKFIYSPEKLQLWKFK
jgi:hypothetical protein